jgi:hypothetical protein
MSIGSAVWQHNGIILVQFSALTFCLLFVAVLYDQTSFCSLLYVISIFAVSSDKTYHFIRRRHD